MTFYGFFQSILQAFLLSLIPFAVMGIVIYSILKHKELNESNTDEENEDLLEE